MAAAATVAPSSFPIMFAIMAFSSVCRRAPTHNASVGAASADPLEQDRENDEGADEGALPIGIDAGHQEAVADDLDQRGADQGGVRAALAAHQIGAADDGGGDDPELIAGAQRIDGRAL